MKELTFGLIKPTVASSHTQVQYVLRLIKASELEILKAKRIFLSVNQAERFYDVHRDKFFFRRLCDHAASGPSVALALRGDDAVARWRELIGSSKVYRQQWDASALSSKLRPQLGLSDTRNGLHGSDSSENARHELAQVFEGIDFDYLLKQP